VARLLRDGVEFDVVTDQTPAHDPLGAYVPAGYTPAAAADADPDDPLFRDAVFGSLRGHAEALLGFRDRGAVVFEYGNGLRAQAAAAGAAGALEIPGFVEAYVRPILARGSGPFRRIALTGDPGDLRRSEDAVMDVVSTDSLRAWIELRVRGCRCRGFPPGSAGSASASETPSHCG